MGECGCPMGPHDPGCYLGCRGGCEGFVDCFLLPFLGSACGKGCVIPAAGAVWLGCDKLCGRDVKFPDQSKPSRAASGVVTLTIRPVKDVAEYKAAYDPYAKKVQQGSAGVRAFFSFIDKSRESTCLQVAWYDSPDDLAKVVAEPDAAVDACYTDDKGFGAVFGLREQETKDALAKTGVAYEYGTLPRGFMKTAPHKGFDGGNYPGPPMIWMSKRWVQPGRNPAIASAFAKVGDLQYYSAPAFLSAFEYTAEDNADQLWSLRWFNDYDMGHVAHFPKTFLSWIPTRVLFTMIPNLKGGLGAEYPVGLSFSTKDNIDKAIAYNAGNKAYDQHYWEDVIGPLPDMGKGQEISATSADKMLRDEKPAAA